MIEFAVGAFLGCFATWLVVTEVVAGPSKVVTWLIRFIAGVLLAVVLAWLLEFLLGMFAKI